MLESFLCLHSFCVLVTHLHLLLQPLCDAPWPPCLAIRCSSPPVLWCTAHGGNGVCSDAEGADGVRGGDKFGDDVGFCSDDGAQGVCGGGDDDVGVCSDDGAQGVRGGGGGGGGDDDNDDVGVCSDDGAQSDNDNATIESALRRIVCLSCIFVRVCLSLQCWEARLPASQRRFI
eukprot:1152084-Pelagomonas_calceolata.AAC.5